MGSDVGQIFPTARLQRGHWILYALVCEKELSHMGKTTAIPIWCVRKQEHNPNQTTSLFFLSEKIAKLESTLSVSTA